MAEKIVYEFQKNKQDMVRAIVRDWNGKRLVDLRVCYQDDEGAWRPGQKGLCLRATMLPELRAAVDALESEVAMIPEEGEAAD